MEKYIKYINLVILLIILAFVIYLSVKKISEKYTSNLSSNDPMPLTCDDLDKAYPAHPEETLDYKTVCTSNGSVVDDKYCDPSTKPPDKPPLVCPTTTKWEQLATGWTPPL